MVGTTLPAVVRVVDLPVGTTVTGAELFEVVQTSAGVGNNAVGTNQVASSLGIASSLSIGTLLTVGGTATVTGTTILNGGLQVTGTTLLTGVTGVVGTSQFTGAFNVVGTSLLTGLFGVVGTSQFTGGFNVVGTSQFTGAFNVVGTTLITGTLGVVGTSLFTGAFNVLGTSTFTGSHSVIGTTLFTSGTFGVVGTALFTSGAFGVVGTATVTGNLYALSSVTIGTTGAYANSSTNFFISSVAENRVERIGLSGGVPASTGATDANQFITFGNANVAWRFGFYASGNMWQQPSLISNYASNLGHVINPNGGSLGIGAVNATGNIPVLLTVAGSAYLQNTLAIPAGGSAALTFSSTQAFGIYFGSGAPSVSAATGSLYFRSDPANATSRMYVNTTGTAVWVGLTAVS